MFCMTLPLSVSKIWQLDNHRFAIAWSDGLKQEWRLSTLQRNCPCAGCVDETSGKRINDPSKISEEVTALQLSNMGRYALKIHYSSGCSHGIYSFPLLRQLGTPLLPGNT